MAIGSLLSKIAKLVSKKKLIQNNIKVLTNKKQPVTKLKAKEKLLDKSIKKLEAQQTPIKETSTKKSKVKTPDRSVVMDHSGKMGSAVRGARYKGKKEAFEKLVDRAEDLRAQGKIKEANKIMNSRKFKDLADWDADYAGRKSGGPIVKKPMGGKVYKNTVSRKHGGAIGVGSALRGFGKGYKKG